ncbi:catalase [Dactylosporangium darangshiense]|uniref:catalase n=1 Tax=Dactylosporangium darangshiense TaxID=579108 RepID=UPI0031E70A0E
MRARSSWSATTYRSSHLGRHQVPRHHPRRQATPGPRDTAGAERARHLLGFVSLHIEAQHHTMWNLSDRGIPRSYRMMEGFGVHTFRLVNAAGETALVKFHWKPKLGSRRPPRPPAAPAT